MLALARKGHWCVIGGLSFLLSAGFKEEAAAGKEAEAPGVAARRTPAQQDEAWGPMQCASPKAAWETFELDLEPEAATYCLRWMV